MLTETEFKIDPKILDDLDTEFATEMKMVLNQPTGNFFYEPWVIKDEFKGTVWETILNSLPFSIGEARIITLESGRNYFQHADIDDRYHLNIKGRDSYLIDLTNKKMHEIKTDGIWYLMDAGRLHSAANFGEHPRVQLVVRKLLSKNNLKDYVNVAISPQGSNPRYVFDNTISPWLNQANKKGVINNFNVVDHGVRFNIEKQYYQALKKILSKLNWD